MDVPLRRHGERAPDERSGHFLPENAGGPAHQSPASFVRAGESPAVHGGGAFRQPGLREGGEDGFTDSPLNVYSAARLN